MRIFKIIKKTIILLSVDTIISILVANDVVELLKKQETNDYTAIIVENKMTWKDIKNIIKSV